MSYRLINSNALAIKYPEVNDMPCIYADLDGLDGGHYDMRSPRVIQAENDKLRELVKAAWRCIHTGICCSDCRTIAGGCTLKTAMRELGVEV